ncbi:MAG: hypothetical protein WBI82_05555 [Sphaerochaeta sp.]
MPPFPPQGAGYLTLLSQHSLGNGTMVMLVLLSLRWGIKKNPPVGLNQREGFSWRIARDYAFTTVVMQSFTIT